MKKVFITRKIPGPGIQKLKDAGYEVKIGSETKMLTAQELIKKSQQADAVITLLTDRIDKKTIQALGANIKIIANYAVGYDNIDLQAAQERKMIVTNTPDVLSGAVAEYTIALTLAITKRIGEADDFMRAGRYKGWEPELFLGIELRNKVFGLVGHGRIGCQVAEKMKQAFGMEIIYFDVFRDQKREEQCGIAYAELPELLERTDVVSLHVPLLDSTHHLIGEKELRSMKQTSYVINTSRGPIIDEKALVKALGERWIAGAALDVFEHEPKLEPGLKKLSNVIITPHIASATKEAREKMSEMVAENVIAALSGREAPNLVRSA